MAGSFFLRFLNLFLEQNNTGKERQNRENINKIITIYNDLQNTAFSEKYHKPRKMRLQKQKTGVYCFQSSSTFADRHPKEQFPCGSVDLLSGSRRSRFTPKPWHLFQA